MKGSCFKSFIFGDSNLMREIPKPTPRSANVFSQLFKYQQMRIHYCYLGLLSAWISRLAEIPMMMTWRPMEHAFIIDTCLARAVGIEMVDSFLSLSQELGGSQVACFAPILFPRLGSWLTLLCLNFSSELDPFYRELVIPEKKEAWKDRFYSRSSSSWPYFWALCLPFASKFAKHLHPSSTNISIRISLIPFVSRLATS